MPTSPDLLPLAQVLLTRHDTYSACHLHADHTDPLRRILDTHACGAMTCKLESRAVLAADCVTCNRQRLRVDWAAEAHCADAHDTAA